MVALGPIPHVYTWCPAWSLRLHSLIPCTNNNLHFAVGKATRYGAVCRRKHTVSCVC